MSESQESRRLLPAWVEAGTVTALLVPLFYTAGWSYAYHYFERFNLGLMGLEIPKEYFFLYSFWAVKDRFWMFLLVLAGLLALFGVGRIGLGKWQSRVCGTAWEGAARWVPSVLFPVLIFFLFWVFYGFGERAAVNAYARQVAEDFPSYQRVKVWAKAPSKGKFGEAMKREWETGCYRLLMRNKDHLFLFYPVHPVGSEDKMPVEIVPAGQVEMVRVLAENLSCQGNQP